MAFERSMRISCFTCNVYWDSTAVVRDHWGSTLKHCTDYIHKRYRWRLTKLGTIAKYNWVALSIWPHWDYRDYPLSACAFLKQRVGVVSKKRDSFNFAFGPLKIVMLLQSSFKTSPLTKNRRPPHPGIQLTE